MSPIFKKHRLTLLFGLLSLSSFMLWGVTAMPKIARAVDYAVQSSGQRIVLNGVLNIMRGDPPPDSGLPHQDFIFLQQDGDRITELQMNMGTALELHGKQVEVVGVATTMVDPGLQGTASASFYVESAHEVTLGGASAQEATLGGTSSLESAQDVTGSRPWVTLLCRFGDIPNITPHPPEWYQELFVNAWGGIDHYWQQMSYGLANIDDPSFPNHNVKGWYNLPYAKSYYMSSASIPDWGRIIRDCTAAADAEVYFPNYAGINLMLNTDLGCCAWGGGWTLDIDGQFRNYSATWMPAWNNVLHIMTHEMGHGFGLPHSSGPYGSVYDSLWDVMSGGGTCAQSKPGYGCMGVGTIAYHQDMLGWIPTNRKMIVSPGSQAIFTLERLRKPLSSTNYLMAQVPIGSTGDFYTVEARKYGGAESYDLMIPGEAVIIHDVDESRAEPAHVVDGTMNSNTNDAGAMWTPGETFSDTLRGIRVSVLASNTSSFDVFVSNGSVNLTAPANGIVTDTMPEFDWTSINGATGYELQTSTNTAFTGDVMSTSLAQQTYTPAPMNDGVYYWRVRALTGSAAGEWSLSRSFTIRAPVPAPMYYQDNTPTLTWGHLSWATGYEVQLDNDSDLSSPFVTVALGVNTLEYTTPMLGSGQYYWRVRALPDGRWSAIQRFVVGVIP